MCDRTKPRWLAPTILVGVVLVVGVVGFWQVRRHYRHMSSRTPTTDRLQQISLAILLFCQDHHGAYPPSLESLGQAEGVAANLSVVPDDDGADTATRYVYLGRGLTADTATVTTPVAHEPLDYFGGTGCNVLFGDGHEEYCTAARMPAVLAHAGPATRPTSAPTVVPSGHG